MFTFICKTSEISEGELFRFDVQEKALLVTIFDGSYFVADSTCTHEEADLSLGMFSSGALTCPLHRAKFDVKTGTVLSGPDGSEPTSILSLKIYPSKVENGELWADI
jgi:3-phenylpropionate/trans-cinnamate dioxygenase ferredoxin subunit